MVFSGANYSGFTDFTVRCHFCSDLYCIIFVEMGTMPVFRVSLELNEEILTSI